MVCTLYALVCKTPGHYYTGTTSRPLYVRLAEHRQGVACKWTQKHGFKRVLFSCTIPLNRCREFEADAWMYLARLHGPHNVRGGEVTVVDRHTDIIPNWILPKEFGGERICDWGFLVNPPNN